MRRSSACLYLMMLLVACGDTVTVGSVSCGTDDEGFGVVQGVDTSRAGITTFVDEGGYKQWLAEPSVHETSEPHSSTGRVFFNDVVADSLRAANAEHPIGSILVLESFKMDGKTLLGRALTVKVAEGAFTHSWIFYEDFGPGSSPITYRLGDSTCSGCHSNGKDFVQSSLP